MKLSDFELEVMQIIWKEHAITAPEVHQQIAAERQVSYSAVKTIIDRLEEKGAVKRARKYGRTILYEAVVKKEQLSKPMVRSFIDKLFGGNVRPLFNHALAEENLSLDDIAYLEKMLQEKRAAMEKK